MFKYTVWGLHFVWSFVCQQDLHPPWLGHNAVSTGHSQGTLPLPLFWSPCHHSHKEAVCHLKKRLKVSLLNLVDVPAECDNGWLDLCLVFLQNTSMNFNSFAASVAFSSYNCGMLLDKRLQTVPLPVMNLTPNLYTRNENVVIETCPVSFLFLHEWYKGTCFHTYQH